MAVGMKSSALSPLFVRVPENKNHSYNVWDAWEALLRDVFPTVVVELWGWIRPFFLLVARRPAEPSLERQLPLNFTEEEI